MYEEMPSREFSSMEKFDITFLADPDEAGGEMAFNWKIKKVLQESVKLEREIAGGIKREATISKERLFRYNPLLKEDKNFLQAFEAAEES